MHCDLWGPAKTITHGGGKYFLSVIDDYSRRVWVYVLKTKDETFGKFKEWLTTTENKIGHKLKHLRTDNGLEFVSNEFNKFCKAKGITRYRTVKHTPQQNGVAERMNRTLLERVRCMLINAGLPKTFWGEAIATAAYLINRSPSSAIGLKTQAEMWYGKPSDYKHLKVFGCQAYAHIKQDKLEPRALRCIFIGYPEGVKGYKLWCLEPGQAKCLISRDAVFDESKMANIQKFNTTPVPTESDGSRIEVETMGNSHTPAQVQQLAKEEITDHIAQILKKNDTLHTTTLQETDREDKLDHQQGMLKQMLSHLL